MSIIIYVIIAISGKERPGYIMLAISEAGTIAVLIAFVLLSNKAGSTDFTLIKLSYKNIPSNLRGWIFFFCHLSDLG